MTLGIGAVGLGVQGRRMLARLAEHGGFRAVAGWDPDPEGARRAAAEGVTLAATADEVIGAPGVDCLFIASPPSSHMALAHRAFDRGLAVFCEKPLAVEAAEAGVAIDRIAREGHRAAVNFSLASSAGLQAVREALEHRALGDSREVRIEAAFSQWPRPWQSAAGAWLGQREEGGFTREVLSHFIFVLQRVLGPATVESSTVTYPHDGRGSETGLEALLVAGGVPVHVRGRVGGNDADFNRFTLVGDRETLELREWLNVRSSSRSGVADRAAGDRPAYLRQLDQLAAFIRGEPHTLPGFSEALAVQRTIEAMLRTSPARVTAPGAP
jgi:predicted dehydrogenase